LFYQLSKTVPVNVGEFNGAFESKAVCAAVETGLLIACVVNIPNPTIVEVTPVTVPMKTGEFSGALNLN
jgi:hypothetical protein